MTAPMTARTRRTLRDLTAITLAVLPLLYVAGLTRGDVPPACPGQQALKNACGKGTAECKTYDVELIDPIGSCKEHSYTEVKINWFNCGSDSSKKYECVPIPDPRDPTKSKQADCTITYECVFSSKDVSKCSQGLQIGNTVTAPLYESVLCPLPPE